MARYVQRVEAAGLPGLISEIRGLAHEWEQEHRKAISDHALGLEDRLHHVLDFSLGRFELTDDDLLWQDLINQVRQRLAQVRDALKQFTNDSQQHGQLQTAQNGLEALLERVTRWPVTEAEDVGDAITDAAEHYRRSLGQRLRPLNDEIEQLRTEVQNLRQEPAKLREELTSQVQTTRDRVSQLEEQAEDHAAELNERLAELQQTIVEDKQRLDNAIARYEEQFSNAQSSRKEDFDEWLANAKQESSTLRNEAEQKAQNLLEKLEAKTEEASKYVNIIGTSGVTDQFGKEAIAQQQAANRWRYIAVGLGLAALSFVIWALATAGIAGVGWGLTVSKLAGSGIILGVAGYAVNQSTQHRRREAEARALEMDLYALGPFIEDLEPEQQRKIRQDLVDRIFGRSREVPSGVQGAITDDSISTLDHLASVLRRMP